MHRGFLAFIILILLLSSRNILAGDVLIPGVEHMEAFQNARRCSIMVAVEQDAESVLNAKSRQIERMIAQVQSARKSLDSCARQVGIQEIDSQISEQTLASYCPENYEQWITPGYQLLFAQRELREAKSSYQLTHQFVERHCKSHRQAVSM